MKSSKNARFPLIREEWVQSQVLDVLRHVDGPPPLDHIKEKCLIACTARSGSSLLCDALKNYGLFADEYFNPAGFVSEAKEVNGISTTRELGQLLARDYAFGGRFAVKFAFPQLPWLFLLDEFPKNIASWKFVYLTRTDLVEQAVSGYIADLTGSWIASITPRLQLSESDYDYDKISGIMESYAVENSLWERFFSLYGVKPLRLTYEALAADTATCTREVADYLGLTVSSQVLGGEFRLTLRRQTTELNRKWVQRTREMAYTDAADAIDAARSI
jgi:LPS sulfotransferase NodH